MSARRPGGAPRLARWLAWLVPPRYRNDVMDDLVAEWREDVRPRLGAPAAGLWLAIEIVRAAGAARWHGRAISDSVPARGVPGRGAGSTAGDLARDLRFALRTYGRAPAFTGVALVTVALGTGGTLALFSVVDAVLLRPLDYPGSERLVHVQGEAAALRGVSFPMHATFLEGSRLLDSGAAWQGWAYTYRRNDGALLRRSGASVSHTYFELLGQTPAAGRLFREADGVPGHEPVVVLSHRTWLEDFQGRSDVVGRTLALDGEPYRVVGVAPEGFEDPLAAILGWSQPTLWRAHPPAFDRGAEEPGWVGFWSVGRLREGASPALLTDEIRAIARRAGWSDAAAREFRAVTLKDALVEGIRPTLLVLFAAVGLVLLIACSNVANLLLSRAAVRTREVAVRIGMGASRGRILRQLLTESGVLAIVGTGAGLLLGVWLTSRILAMPGLELPRSEGIVFDARVFAFAAAVMAVTTLLFGLVPALRLSGSGVEPLRDASRGSLGDGRSRALRSGLVVVETGLSVVLLIGAGLLAKTLWKLQTVDPGFDTERAAIVGVGLPQEEFPTSAEQTDALNRALQAALGLPRASAVGAITDLPMSGRVNSTTIRPVGAGDEGGAGYPSVLVRAATPDYFRAMGIPLLDGRPFLPSDDEGAPEVALVNAEFVRRALAGGDAVGEVLDVRGVERTVVGVVANVKEFTLEGGDEPVLYTPYAQEDEEWMRTGVTVIARIDGDPSELAERIRTALLDAVPGLTVGRPGSLAGHVDAHVAEPRLRSTLVVIFAALALLLTAVGMAGVMAYGVSRRIPEIGLRMAVGAGRTDVASLVVRQAMALTGMGIALGLVAAALSTRVLASFLFGVEADDLTIFLSAPLVLAVVALVASWLPARRAARVDPSVALRAE